MAAGDGSQVLIVGVADGLLDRPSPVQTRLFVLSKGLGAQENWIRYWEAGATPVMNVIARAPNGDFVVAAYATTSTGPDDTEPGDVLVMRLDAGGERLWAKRWGVLAGQDDIGAIAIDAAGAIYVGGRTFGDLAAPNAGRADLALSKLDATGNVIWSTQWGTDGRDRVQALALDAAGNIYTAGYVTGELPDAGGHNGNEDAFVTKHSPSGDVLWSRQWDASMALSIVIASDDEIYVGGGSGSFVYKWNSDGDLIWSETIGGGAICCLALDAQGQLLSASTLGGTVDGQTGFGDFDVFVARWLESDDTATRQWSQFYGTPEEDSVHGLALDAQGRILLTGLTWGAWPGFENAGESDVFLLQITPP